MEMTEKMETEAELALDRFLNKSREFKVTKKCIEDVSRALRHRLQTDTQGVDTEGTWFIDFCKKIFDVSTKELFHYTEYLVASLPFP